MPTDRHGITHAGALGLYDDDDEYDAAMRRMERHERERLASEIRRQERLAAKEHRQAMKAARRDNEPPSRLPKQIARLGKLFSSKSGESSASQGKCEDVKRSEPPKSSQHDPEVPPSGFIVVRRPSTPEPVYTMDDVDPIDSPWLDECGMVRVITNDISGCRIVPKSSIEPSK